MGATFDQPVGPGRDTAQHQPIDRSFSVTVGQLLAAATIFIGLTFFPLVAIGPVRRSGFGSVRSAVRVGYPSASVRVLMFVATLLVLLACVALVVTLFRRRALASMTLTVVIAAVAMLWCIAAAVVSDRVQWGVWVVSAATLALLVLSFVARRRGVARVGEVRRNRGGSLVGLIVGVGGGVVVGALLWFGFGFRGGATRPDAAVERFVGALQSGDTLGALELLDPVEREVVVNEGPAVFQELRRLRVLGGSALVGTDEQRVSASVGDSRLISDGLVSVSVDGSLRVPRALTRPLGGEIADAVRRPGRLVSVRRDGRWYVSLLFGAAEQRRLSLGATLPLSAIEPAGAPNPEGAVQRFLTAVSDVDLPTLIALTDPHEASVAYRYGLLQQPDLDRLAAWSAANARWSFPDVGLVSSVKGDRAVVRVTRMSAQLNLPSDLGIGSSVVLNGDCVRVTVEQETSRHCGSEIPQVIADLFGVTAPDLGDLGWLTRPESLGEIVVVKRDGEWFIAPASTMAASVAVHLRTYDVADFQGEGRDLASRVQQLGDNPIWQLIRDLLGGS